MRTSFIRRFSYGWATFPGWWPLETFYPLGARHAANTHKHILCLHPHNGSVITGLSPAPFQRGLESC